IDPHESFVLYTFLFFCFIVDELQDECTLYLWQHKDQTLPTSTEKNIMFTPHYDTLIKSGTHEYYAENQKALPYALAELVDNSLSATAKNKGLRTIEIRLVFEKTLGKNGVLVLDNGCGMTSTQLNNWAVYRLSKFSRQNSKFSSEKEGYVRPDDVPRSLNSDISYFGVGGKQAAFFIGDSVRMISKPWDSPYVHELALSKEDFQRKEENNEDVYTGRIVSRMPCDPSQITDDERFLHDVVREESGKQSFTVVVITGILTDHINYLKQDFETWTRELAHIYHYYIHGSNGNVLSQPSCPSRDLTQKIDILVTLREKPPKSPILLNLRYVNNDMQTLYINAAADSFEFQATTAGDGGKVEGVLRYHPFLYDRETYPKNPCASQASDNGKKDIFECFWNGRLIPYTTVSEFDWCSRPKKGSALPAECFSRLSGVLFTNDKFSVSTNKLKFMELELKLRNKETIFTPILKDQVSRNIEKEFMQWLQSCHERYDKQVRFFGFRRTITRTDVPGKQNSPWGEFSAIEWDGKIYQTGQLVKSQRKTPTLYGTIVRFLLHGEYDGDVFATGGEVEVTREPSALYNDTKIMPISKIDRTATDEVILKGIEKDNDKLPDKLRLEWKEEILNPQIPAGSSIGPLLVEILNRKGDVISHISAGQGPGTWLSVGLKVIRHEWFLTYKLWISGGLRNLFSYFDVAPNTLSYFLDLSCLPLLSTLAAKEDHFTLSQLSPAYRVGNPFDIVLQIKDHFGHPTALSSDTQPVLQCSGLDVSYETVSKSDTKVTIKGVVVRGKIQMHQQEKEESAEVENGSPVMFNVEIHDEAGNLTANPKQLVRCQVEGFKPVVIDCCKTGAGQVVTKPVQLNITDGEPQTLQVKFELLKNVAPVVIGLKVVPSTRVARIEVYSQSEDLVLRNKEKISWPAGGLLENLCYRLFNERGVEVPLTADITSKIKVNWTGDANSEDLVLGKLPEIQVPTQLQGERFCQVSYQEQNVSFCFTVTPCANEPSRLKATLPQNTLKLGQVLAEHIYLNLVDQFDNVTKRLPQDSMKDMTVEADGLDTSKISFAWQQSSNSVALKGIRFHSGPLGPRELCFHYKSFEERVIIKVTAGEPAELKLISGPEQPLQVLKGHGIPTPFLLQLCDEWGNPSPDQRVVVEVRSSRQSLKLTMPVISQPVNAEGKAQFSVLALNFKGSFNEKPIRGPSVFLTVIPDPNKPVRLSVEYDKTAKLLAGGTFPVFSVTVVSDEGSPITDINPADFSMLLWKGESSTPPETTPVMKCSKPMENEKNDCYYFRDKSIPVQIGPHTIQFTLRNDKTKVPLLTQIKINVVPNQPFKLAPTSIPKIPVVSYSMEMPSRTLVENMTLVIMDKFGNPAGQNLKGRVTVSISCPDQERRRNLPLFEGKTQSVHFNLEKGEAHINRLAIMEKSPGENGSIYVLTFHPDVSTPLDPFQLNFHFYNGTISDIKETFLLKYPFSALIFYFFSQLFISLQVSRVEQMIHEKMAEAAQFERAPRRVCSIPNNFSGPDVVGVVGHLALIEDDDAARVISWHLGGDMDCVITRTTEAAKRIYDDTQGNQQVLPLDSIRKNALGRTLPHIKNGRSLFDPDGNPVFARHLLICPKETEICTTVFRNLLDDTIVMDDLNSATNYRREVGAGTYCSTILTRDGNRVSARGKFGGSQNKAPPIGRLRVFASPLPQRYYVLKEETEKLREYHVAVTKKEKAEEDQRNHYKSLESPEMKQKQEQLNQMKLQLQEIEMQLGEILFFMSLRKKIVFAYFPFNPPHHLLKS
uniref:Structural maintenance of chromosomes flexible hinge domain containing 1 n=1 Tax=Oryzias melastigma TaxID=30732 RepID=A0A3B3B7I9_ORYME